jgi:predicted  nucleic acid-binding Zn-ribbon protein
MDEAAFKKKLSELVKEIKALPNAERRKLALVAGETKRRQKELKNTVTQLHDSIDFLRLSIKYLVFDLEATRRENAELRKMLEEQHGS